MQEAGEHRGLVVDKLAINVELPTEPNSFPLFESSATDFWSSQTISSLHRRLHIDDDQMEDGEKAATQLADLVSRKIEGLLKLDYCRFSFGKFLYEKIGAILIQVAGKAYQEFDVTSLLSRMPLDGFFGSSLREERRLNMARWIAAAEERRKEVHMPVLARPAYRQKFLDDVGITS